MDPIELRLRLKLNGISQADIARELGISRVSVLRVIDGASRSRRVADQISQQIGLHVSEIWPEYYAKTGAVLRRRRRVEGSMQQRLLKRFQGLRAEVRPTNPATNGA